MMLYRTARTLARLTVRELAAEADVSTATITKLENGKDLKPATLHKIRTVLEEHGVEFIPHKRWAEWVQPRFGGKRDDSRQ
ncbi:helix-turn-helix domain-containing protein [Mesorhizobium sp. AaZ16]|uniref:helix-turn-helix domain-containing protein n=1 Tax=Mesorhizobium sp. AaZ16 TaxID=3402289 RepID=UPI00374E98C4